MTALAHTPSAFAIRPLSSATASTDHRTLLRPTEDGWSLIAPDGALIYRGLGRNARRQCLEAARARGILAVLS